jgi:hypothetical protein
MAIQPCTTCGGSGALNVGNTSVTCPNCEGTGKAWDPGRQFEYEMGPFTLNAAASAQGNSNQNSAGLASTQASIQGVSTQIVNYPFRCMFLVSRSTFPYSIQLADAGSGGGRYFSPQQTQVHSENMFGDSRHPMPWPTPYVFRENQNITANVTDLVGATGFVSVTGGNPNVTWISGGLFNTAAPFGPALPGQFAQMPYWNGQTINIGGVNYVISNALGSGVTSQAALVLASNYLGVTNANIAYAVSNTIRIGFLGQELGRPKAT